MFPLSKFLPDPLQLPSQSTLFFSQKQNKKPSISQKLASKQKKTNEPKNIKKKPNSKHKTSNDKNKQTKSRL